MPAFLHDLRYALRQLRRSPGFTATAILTLALGLGGAATMARVVHDVLLAPLPYSDPARLVGVAFTFPQGKPNAEQTGPTAAYIAEHSRSFASTGLADDGNGGVNLLFSHGSPVQVRARHISAEYFRTLGIAPALGHNFTHDEDLPHGPHVILLSHALWQRSFHGDPSITGRAIRIDGEPYTVAGVMPADFRDPGTVEPTDVWEPMQLSPGAPGYDGDNYVMVGRLRPGVTLAAAQAEVGSLNDGLYREHPGYRHWFSAGRQLHGYRVWPLAAVLTGTVRGLSLIHI